MQRRLHLMGRVLDLDGLTVDGDGIRERLTPQEAQVIALLVQANGATVGKDQLLRAVWHTHPRVRTRAVENAVYRLRRKLERDPARPAALVSVRGVGYRLVGWEPAQVDHPRREARHPGLMGRADALARLEALVVDGPVVITGVAGVGKTALAAAWATQVGAPLASLSDGDGGILRLAADLEVPFSPTTPQQSALVRIVRAVAARGHQGLVIDGIEAAPDLGGRLLDAGHEAGLQVVGTSLHPVSTHEVLPLGPLPLDDAAELFRRAARPRHPHDLPDSLVRAVVQRLDALPLGLELAAGALSWTDPATLLALLEATTPLPTGGDRPDRLRQALERTWHALPGPLAELLFVIASFHHGAPVPALQAVLDVPRAAIADGLASLQARALLQRGGPPRTFSVVRDLAVRQLDPARRDQLLRARAEWVSNHAPTEAVAAALQVRHLDPDLSARCWYAACAHMRDEGPLDLDVADRMVEAAERAGRDLGPARVLRGAIRTLAGRLEAAASDLEEVSHQPDATGLEAAIRLAWLTMLRGDAHRAARDLEAAVGKARQLGHQALEALALVRLASVCHRLGRFPAAAGHLSVASGLYEALDVPLQVARCRASLGLMHAASGDAAAASSELEAALTLDRARGAVTAVCQHLLNLGSVKLHTGRTQEGLEHLEDAWTTAREVGDAEVAGLAMLALGIEALCDGRHAEALRRFTRARAELEVQGNPQNVAAAWCYSSLAHLAAGDLPAGLDARERVALQLAEHPLPHLAGLLHACDAARASVRGAPEEAAALLDRARERPHHLVHTACRAARSVCAR